MRTDLLSAAAQIVAGLGKWIPELAQAPHLRLNRCASTSSGVASARNLAMSHPLRQLYRVLLSQITCISRSRIITVATLTQWQEGSP